MRDDSLHTSSQNTGMSTEDVHMNDILKQLLQEEQELQFTKFNEGTAWQIGGQLVERSMRDGLPVTIDITRGDHQLFHASLQGTSADNDEWIKRKVRLVNRFGHSSFYMGQLLKSKGKRLEEAYLLPESDYAPHGGCFPIIIKGTGVIGTITVSGLPQEEDHKLVVQTVRDFLAQEK
jgi:uncharacterized protein (UPF0303 family)